MSKIVEVIPKARAACFEAMKWQNPGDWVDICEFMGRDTGDTKDNIKTLVDTNGKDFHRGWWVVHYGYRFIAYRDKEFRENWELVKND